MYAVDDNLWRATFLALLNNELYLIGLSSCPFNKIKDISK
jgi:hypothetical protein